MRKSTVGIIIAIVALLAVVGLVMANKPESTVPSTAPQTAAPSNQNPQSETEAGDEQPRSQADDPTQTSRSVEIVDYAFTPASITVKKGTTVTWTNKDSDRHDVSPDQESADFKGSELLARGESYSFTFNKTGTYAYHCSPHPHMKGTVVVTD